MTTGPIDVACLIFDVFGTLFDHDSAVREAAPTLDGRAAEVTALWRRKQLEYSWQRTLMHRPTDFRTVTEEALDYALEALGLPGWHQASIMASYRRLSPFAETKAALEGLRAGGRRCAILSNGSAAMLAPLLAEHGMDSFFEAVLSAEDANVFKPHPLVYRLAADRLGLVPERLCLVSSNSWDAVGAAAFGMKAVWVNRADAPAERLPAAPDAVVKSLDALEGVLR